MTRQSIFRSAVQFAVLCLTAVLLSTTPASAAGWDCTAKAAECSSQCGTNITVQYQYSLYHEWVNNGVTYGEWDHYFNYLYGSGISNFECDEHNETAYCQCAM